MNRQLRVLMPVGFLLIFSGLWQGRGTIHLAALWQKICTFPTALFFGITVIGMICMSVFAVKLDGTKLRSNWIEQIANAICTGMFSAGGAQSPLDCPHHMPIRSSCCICSFVS